MVLGIESEALALAAPYILGFIGFMYALLIGFTVIRWKKSQDAKCHESIRSLHQVELGGLGS